MISILLSSESRGVEENMASTDMSIRRRTIIHITLSPSILSMSFQRPFLEASGCVYPLFSIFLKVSYSFLELSSSVFVVLEKIEACAAWREEYHVS